MNEVMIHQRGIDNYYKIWHTSGKNTILYIYSGTGSIVANERNYHINGGTLCFIGGEKFHYTLPEQPDFYERSKVFINPDETCRLLSIFPKELDVQQLFSPTTIFYARVDGDDRHEVELLFEQIGKACKDTKYGKTAMLSCCIRLFALLIKNASQLAPRIDNVIEQAVEYINSNISSNITIEHICKELHISKYYFCRKFKAVTGFTVMEYILKTRITNAKSLLREKRTISEISELCGFSSFSYFSRAFKKDTGLTPLQYRKTL